MTDPIVLVGGFAAAHAATELRAAGCTDPIVLITAEEHLPYERPPLSKGYLLGKDERSAGARAPRRVVRRARRRPPARHSA